MPVGRPRDSGTLMRVCMPQLSSFLTQILGCPSTRGSRAMHSNADPSRSLCASGMRHARSRDMDNVAAAWRREAARRGGLTGCAGGVAGGADVVSVSEFDSDADLAERHAAVAGAAAAARRPGLVERQDSANYQPRPPAMTERQDSAQNLQARTARVRPLRVLACRLWTACPPPCWPAPHRQPARGDDPDSQLPDLLLKHELEGRAPQGNSLLREAGTRCVHPETARFGATCLAESCVGRHGFRPLSAGVGARAYRACRSLSFVLAHVARGARAGHGGSGGRAGGSGRRRRRRAGRRRGPGRAAGQRARHGARGPAAPQRLAAQPARRQPAGCARARRTTPHVSCMPLGAAGVAQPWTRLGA